MERYCRLSQLIFHCKLSSHLCGHKGMGNAILFKITLKCNEIKADFFRNNVKALQPFAIAL